MVQINFATREVNCRIVYYGPAGCGKTTNLQFIHDNAPHNSVGDLVLAANDIDRALCLEFRPQDVGLVAGMRTKFQLYTVPGQVHSDNTCKLAVQACDGVVFVADSSRDRTNENIESLNSLARNLVENGLDILEIPLVIQLNKRDIPNLLSVAELAIMLDRKNWPIIEAAAINGDGVFRTLNSISQLVIKRLNRTESYEEARPRGRTMGAVMPPPPKPPERVKPRVLEDNAAPPAPEDSAICSVFMGKNNDPRVHKLVAELHGISLAEASRYCQKPIVALAKEISADDAQKLRQKFAALNVTVRITKKT